MRSRLLRCIKISHEDVYFFDDVKTDIEDLFDGVCRECKRKQNVEYYNIPVAFDIETSSFYDGLEKRACMYIWMFSIDDNIIIGRTWDDFLYLCSQLVEYFSLDPKRRRMIIYVHNLGFEFQFMCQRFVWEKIFAISKRQPLTALTDTGIEFRCSQKLSGYKLETVGKNLLKYKVEKMTGDLDYTLPRHSETPLSDTELGYCINDVRVLSAYIREKIETDGCITKIPLTKTGYVRLYCRQHIYGTAHRKTPTQYKRYRELMTRLTIDPFEFKLLQQCFQGGFTHANPFIAGKILEDLASYDYNSSYPTQLIAEKFPMGKGEQYQLKDKKDFEYQIKHYCCMFVVRFTGIASKILYETYLSYSKCRNISGAVLNNGRVVSADTLETTVTELDWSIIKQCYEWDKMEISIFYRYKKGYLPSEFVECILDFYQQKTTLKNVPGKETEYASGKANLNSCYGMTVTNPAKPMVTFFSDPETDAGSCWGEKAFDLSEEIEKYNNKTTRFLFYPWGIWCTAHARFKLWNYGILKVGPDYCYSDTDSIKFVHPEDHADFVKEYNDYISKKLLKAMRYHHLDPQLIAPRTIKGIPKPLGIWELDGNYKMFKTLGAKRYMVLTTDDDIEITIAGLNKKAGKDYISSQPEPFRFFTEDMYIPADYSGKLTATYIDEKTSGVLVDYKGIPGKYEEYSALHMEKTHYEMGIAAEYAAYILGITESDEELM